MGFIALISVFSMPGCSPSKTASEFIAFIRFARKVGISASDVAVMRSAWATSSPLAKPVSKRVFVNSRISFWALMLLSALVS